MATQAFNIAQSDASAKIAQAALDLYHQAVRV
jgi:hypothetical protein